ncbi:MAG: response regulator transcription factor [Micavibrio sp.]|nr:response regulator transcription factor [Micavibrio sp.]
MSYTIALVDDDRNIIASVSMALKAEGYKVLSYNDGYEGYEGIVASKPDLAVLDIKMPRMDGHELLKKLRSQIAIPVIFLTSKDDEIDEILGLRLGADDYISKPFSQRLLLERIRTLIRRSQLETKGEDSKGEESEVHVGKLRLDNERHLCMWSGQSVNLTVTEYMLLKALAERPGHVKSRDQLMDAAYGHDMYIDDRTIDTHIKRVRKKFKKVDESFDEIETLYGIGYKYREN